jgi:type IV secretory pathway component VirB8
MTFAVDRLVTRATVTPMVFVADRSTGLVERMTDLAGETITEAAAFNRNFAASYVLAREGYVWEEVSTRNTNVAAYSSQDEYARYLAQQRAPGGAPQVYGRRATVRIMIKAVHLMSDPKDEAKRGIVTVFFDRAEIKAGDDVSPFWDEKTGCLRQTPTCHRYSANIDFERIGTRLPENLRTKNPLGWLVTQYEARPEGS